MRFMATSVNWTKQFHALCRTVLADPSLGAGVQFAKSYARAGLSLWTNSDILTQAQYIRANLRGVRDGRDIRRLFDELIAALDQYNSDMED